MNLRREFPLISLPLITVIAFPDPRRNRRWGLLLGRDQGSARWRLLASYPEIFYWHLRQYPVTASMWDAQDGTAVTLNHNLGS